MTRLAPLPLEQMNTAQRQVYQSIMSGPRGKFGGPFPALLRCPQLSEKVAALGECLRFDSGLSASHREIAILCAAHHWNCQVEWDAHVVIALQLGISQSLIRCIADAGHPIQGQNQDQAVLNFCHALCRQQQISDSRYQAALDVVGEQGLVELVVVVGYFSLLAMVLETFQVKPDPVDGVPPENLGLRAC